MYQDQNLIRKTKILFYKNWCFRPEERYLATDEYGFDDYGDYPYYTYSSALISVEYKQPGYLETNREI